VPEEELPESGNCYFVRQKTFVKATKEKVTSKEKSTGQENLTGKKLCSEVELNS